MTQDPILSDQTPDSVSRPTHGKGRVRTRGPASTGHRAAALARPRRSRKAPSDGREQAGQARAESASRVEEPQPESVSGLRAGARPLAIVPRSLEEAKELARAVVASGLAPRGFDTAEACMVAILHGLEVGLAPLAALQRIAIIEGRPTIWGDGALALVRASGLAEWIEEAWEGTGPADWCAICRVRRKGDPSPIERRFSVDDARRADLWGRPGPWQRYPLRMLQMRARAFALRDAFADVLGGLYLREELEGEPPSRPTAVTGAPAPTSAAGGGGRAGEPDAQATPSSPSRGSPESVIRDTITPGSRMADSATQKPIEQTPEPRVPLHPRSLRHPLRAPPPSWFGRLDDECLSSSASLTPDPVLPAEGRSPPHGKPSRQSPISVARRNRSRSTAQALRLRREAGWTIPRPRRLAGRPAPARQDRGNAANELEFATRARPVAVSQPADVLALIDDALSCANDPESLAEILEEIAERLIALGENDRALAQRIIERHHLRVQALPEAPSASTGDPGQPAKAREDAP